MLSWLTLKFIIQVSAGASGLWWTASALATRPWVMRALKFDRDEAVGWSIIMNAYAAISSAVAAFATMLAG